MPGILAGAIQLPVSNRKLFLPPFKAYQKKPESKGYFLPVRSINVINLTCA